MRPEEWEMTANAAEERRCGNCGAVVPADAVTCPACDALLAAYEAPSGSSETASTDVQRNFESTPPFPTSPPDRPIIEQATPRSLETPRQEFSAEVAIEEARRTLGMATAAEPEISRHEPAQETILPVPPASMGELHSTDESLKEARRALLGVLASRANNAEAKPTETRQLRRRDRKLGPPPTRTLSRMVEERNSRSRTSSPNPSTSRPGGQPYSQPVQRASRKDHPITTILHLAFLGVFAFLFLSIARNFPFVVSPFIMIIFAIVILSHLMRIVAGATGRKTTTMRNPNSRSGWKR